MSLTHQKSCLEKTHIVNHERNGGMIKIGVKRDEK